MNLWTAAIIMLLAWRSLDEINTVTGIKIKCPITLADLSPPSVTAHVAGAKVPKSTSDVDATTTTTTTTAESEATGTADSSKLSEKVSVTVEDLKAHVDRAQDAIDSTLRPLVTLAQGIKHKLLYPVILILSELFGLTSACVVYYIMLLKAFVPKGLAAMRRTPNSMLILAISNVVDIQLTGQLGIKSFVDVMLLIGILYVFYENEVTRFAKKLVKTAEDIGSTTSEFIRLKVTERRRIKEEARRLNRVVNPQGDILTGKKPRGG